MLHGDRDLARRSIDLACGCVDYPLNYHGERRLQDTGGSLNVRIHIRIRRVVRVRDGNERREVKYSPASPERGPNAVGIAYVACEHLEMPPHIVRAMNEPTPGVEGVVQHERAHVVPCPHE